MRRKSYLVMFLLFCSPTLAQSNISQLYEESSPRNYSLSLNPFAFLLLGGEETLLLSIGYTLFFNDLNTELAIPVLFASSNTGNVFNLEAQYRMFLDAKQHGYFAYGLFRYTAVEGQNFENSYFGENDTFIVPLRLTHKLGVGVGFGHRFFLSDRLYWDVAFATGTYVLGNSYENNTMPPIFYSKEFFVDLEFLKHGYTF